MNTDNGMDGGTIEISHDNGVTWRNLIQDTVFINSGNMYTLNDTVASLEKPGFSGSFGWDYIQLNYQLMTSGMLDTITFRFTFASDSIQTNEDGWMIGLIDVSGFFEGIKEIQNHNSISISPNPVSDELRIQKNTSRVNGRIQILNDIGETLFDFQHFTEEAIDTRQFPNGIYLLKYSDKTEFSVKKFIVQR
jgi:hypothetical protein